MEDPGQDRGIVQECCLDGFAGMEGKGNRQEIEMTQRAYIINGNRYRVEILYFDGRKAEVRVNGRTYVLEVEGSEQDRRTPLSVTLAPYAGPAPGVSSPPTKEPEAVRPTKPVPPPQRAVPAGPVPRLAGGQITAPMSGVVLEVLAKKGQSVGAGETLLILEAMKMENEIQATKGGKIKEIHVKAGEEVRAGDALVDLE
jgi:biotin carboxyl carrier protein